MHVCLGGSLGLHTSVMTLPDLPGLRIRRGLTSNLPPPGRHGLRHNYSGTPFHRYCKPGYTTYISGLDRVSVLSHLTMAAELTSTKLNAESHLLLVHRPCYPLACLAFDSD